MINNYYQLFTSLNSPTFASTRLAVRACRIEHPLTFNLLFTRGLCTLFIAYSLIYLLRLSVTVTKLITVPFGETNYTSCALYFIYSTSWKKLLLYRFFLLQGVSVETEWNKVFFPLVNTFFDAADIFMSLFFFSFSAATCLQVSANPPVVLARVELVCTAFRSFLSRFPRAWQTRY